MVHGCNHVASVTGFWLVCLEKCWKWLCSYSFLVALFFQNLLMLLVTTLLWGNKGVSALQLRRQIWATCKLTVIQEEFTVHRNATKKDVLQVQVLLAGHRLDSFQLCVAFSFVTSRSLPTTSIGGGARFAGVPFIGHKIPAQPQVRHSLVMNQHDQHDI